MKRFNRIFATGLLTLIPIAVSVYILYSGIFILENLLGSLIRAILPPSAYVPGLGFFLTLILIFLFGLALNNLLTQKLLLTLEQKLTEIPFFKAIYSPLRDLMNLFSKKGQGGMKSVVLVDIGNNGTKMLGIVTRDQFQDLNINKDLSQNIAVYLPLSYGLGGFTILATKSQITPIDLPIEKAMSLAITGWVKAETKEHQ